MNWKLVKAMDIMDFKNGKKKPDDLGSIPIYGGNGILGYTNDFNYENSIIIGRVGAYCGSVFYERSKHWVSDNAISAVNRENSDVLFDYYLLRSLDLNQRHIGTGQPLLTQNILNSIEIKLPPLAEQQEIGRTLRALDDKIENNAKINHHLPSPISATDSSPDIRRGKRVSRSSAKRAFSLQLLSIVSKIGCILSSNAFISFVAGAGTNSVSKSRVTMASKTAPFALRFNFSTTVSAR